MARPGAFAANFTPEVLDRFRDLVQATGEAIHEGSQLLASCIWRPMVVLDGRVAADPVDPDKKKDRCRWSHCKINFWKTY